MNTAQLTLVNESTINAAPKTEGLLHSALFNEFPIRVLGTPDDPLFVAADVCRILDIANPSDALKSLDSDEKMTLDNPEGHSGQRGGAQFFNVVTESGLYALIFKSRKPEAKTFRKWVTSEVLPAIRGTGRYQAARSLPVSYLDALKALTAEVEAKEQLVIENATLSRDNEVMQPKAEFFDAAMTSKQGLLVRDAAKLISPAVPGGMGERRLFAWLRAHGWLMPGNRPYQDRIDSGHMTMTERPVLTNSHGTIISITPRITQRGLALLFRRIAGMDTATAEQAASVRDANGVTKAQEAA